MSQEVDPINTQRSQDHINLLYRHCLQNIDPMYSHMVESCLSQIENTNIPIKDRFDLLYYTYNHIKEAIELDTHIIKRIEYRYVKRCLIEILLQFVQSGKLPENYPTRFD